jgi:hypothetical protein
MIGRGKKQFSQLSALAEPFMADFQGFSRAADVRKYPLPWALAMVYSSLPKANRD